MEKLKPKTPEEVSHPLAMVWQSLDMNLEKVVRNHILRVMDLAEGDKTKAAKMMGISVKTVYNKLEQYGLHTPGGEKVQ